MRKEGSVTYLSVVSKVTSIILQVGEKTFQELMHLSEGKEKLKQIVLFYKTEVTKKLFEVELEKSRVALEL